MKKFVTNGINYFRFNYVDFHYMIILWDNTRQMIFPSKLLRLLAPDVIVIIYYLNNQNLDLYHFPSADLQICDFCAFLTT